MEVFLVSISTLEFRNSKLEEQNLKGVKTSHVLSIPRQNDESSNSICDFFFAPLLKCNTFLEVKVGLN